MMNLMLKTLSFIFLLKLSLQNDIKGFDDTITFDIDWPGKLPDDFDFSNRETIEVMSSMNEKYKCIIPNIVEKTKSSDHPYTGPGPLELLSPLFTSKTCSFRLESYWDYEVCHGRFIRQYHEEREGKKVKVQEYFLGKWDEKHLERLLNQAKGNQDNQKDEKVPTKKIENVNLPYFELTMDNGTACDLNNNKPRVTNVLYFCHTQGKHEVYSIKEISTCVYELIILTPLLCVHPKYEPIDTSEHKINCIPVDGALDKPYNLLKLKHESAQLRKSFDLDGLKVELINFDKDTTPANKMIDSATSSAPFHNKIVDTSPVENFLKGKHCLYGGTGWWKFEFCYGKKIEQYHLEKDGSRTSINLGKFTKEKHLDWIKNHQHKRPKPIEHRTQLSHFYSDGDVCDKTGKSRQTEVKLKCLKNPTNPSAVSLYLLEPKYCEYILGVESPIICEILARADEDGLVEINSDMDQEVVFTVKL